MRSINSGLSIVPDITYLPKGSLMKYVLIILLLAFTLSGCANTARVITDKFENVTYIEGRKFYFKENLVTTVGARFYYNEGENVVKMKITYTGYNWIFMSKIKIKSIKEINFNNVRRDVTNYCPSSLGCILNESTWVHLTIAEFEKLTSNDVSVRIYGSKGYIDGSIKVNEAIMFMEFVKKSFPKTYTFSI